MRIGAGWSDGCGTQPVPTWPLAAPAAVRRRRINNTGEPLTHAAADTALRCVAAVAAAAAR